MSRPSIIAMLLFATAAGAHSVPTQLPEPVSAGEAWNVLEESASNVDKLLSDGLYRDVRFQLANSVIAAKWLQSHAASDQVETLIERLGADASAMAVAGEADPLKKSWSSYRQTLGELEKCYPARVVASIVYICPMHALDRHLSADDKCTVCGMSLVRRHLPASTVYEAPGEATMKMDVSSEPLVVGKPATVKIRLSKRNGDAVALADLVEMHTKKIHLLINDASLGDYRHEHPEPTAVAGEYQFRFTPTHPGPYRIWADVVPAASGVQEYVIGDVAAATSGLAVADRETTTRAVVGGRVYTLAFDDQAKPIQAGQTVIGAVSVADANGKPCTHLEPVMGAFAHIVGFNEDHKTVLHIHPAGAEPKTPEERGGPAFAFKFYAPTAGFYRLYVQVQIEGKPQFAPFNLTVAAVANR